MRMAVDPMSCEHFQQNAALYVYDELEDDLRHALELHIESCANCNKEVEQLRAMRTVFSMEPVEEPSASMLASSRMRLQEALEQEQPARSWSALLHLRSRWMDASDAFSPALSAVLVIAGFAGGALTSYRLAAHRAAAHSVSPSAPQEASIAGIRGIEQDASNPNLVHIRYDRVLPEQAEGAISDPKIQRLLCSRHRANGIPGSGSTPSIC